MNNVVELRKPAVLRFGKHDEWAVSEDDGCLRFHPQYELRPELTATYIWREAWMFVFEQGGFDAVRDRLRAMS